MTPENRIGKDGGRKSFWWRLLSAIPVFVVAILLTVALSREGVFRKTETTALDTQTRLLETSDKESDVVIIQITDNDYKGLFNGKSPLDPAALKSLISAIALDKPKVIGVDIDTSASQFQEMHTEDWWPPVIWARTAAYSHINNRFQLFEVLGGQNPTQLSGMIVMKEDSDGAIRRYSRSFNTQEGVFPSFPWVLANQFSPGRANQGENIEEEYFIKYTRYKGGEQFIHVDASNIIAFSKEVTWQENPLLKDKIVIIGGAYAASDEHDTPLGWMLGADILAFTTQTELQGGGIRPAPSLAVLFLQVSNGFLLLLLFQQFRLSRAVLLSLIVIPVLSLACSLIAYKSVAFWAYFAPILIAVLAQQLYDQIAEYRKKLVAKLYNDVSGQQQGEASTKEPSPDLENKEIPSKTKHRRVKRHFAHPSKHKS